MLDFSGGLDSSIIASVLAAAGVDLQLLNFRYGTGAGDEAQEARQTAHALGLDCHVVDLDPASVDVDRSASSQLHINARQRPHRPMVAQGIHAHVQHKT
jgi:asparagine synthase (glutamine-hydrolysing)